MTPTANKKPKALGDYAISPVGMCQSQCFKQGLHISDLCDFPAHLLFIRSSRAICWLSWSILPWLSSSVTFSLAALVSRHLLNGMSLGYLFWDQLCAQSLGTSWLALFPHFQFHLLHSWVPSPFAIARSSRLSGQGAGWLGQSSMVAGLL